MASAQKEALNTQKKQHRPQIRNIILSSVDGKIAFHPKESTQERKHSGFACDKDFLRLQKLTAECDVVFIGAQTIESEQGAFRVSHLRPDGTEPHWIVFTRSGDIPFQSPFWTQQGIPKSIFFVSSFDLVEPAEFHIKHTDVHGAQIPYQIGNLAGLFRYLEEKSFRKAALLGGGKLNEAFWQHDMVDELYLTISPVLVGHRHAPQLVSGDHILKKQLKMTHFSMDDDFLYVDYRVK